MPREMDATFPPASSAVGEANENLLFSWSKGMQGTVIAIAWRASILLSTNARLAELQDAARTGNVLAGFAWASRLATASVWLIN